MRFSPSFATVLTAILILAAQVVPATAQSYSSEKEDSKSAQTSEELLAIIEKQEALIKALRARIKELEQDNKTSPSGTPSKQ